MTEHHREMIRYSVSLQLVYEVLRTGQPYRDSQASALSGQENDRLIRHHLRRWATWGPSSFAQRRLWFPEGTIHELIETGENCVFSEEPFDG
jgi:hypothetical protein